MHDKGAAVLVHPDFYALMGGGERVAASVAEVLRELQFDVYLVARPPFRLEKAVRILGIDLSWIHHIEYSSPKIKLYPYIRYYNILLSAKLSGIAARKRLSDVKARLELITQRPEYALNLGQRQMLYVHEIIPPHVNASSLYRLYTKLGDKRVIKNIRTRMDVIATSSEYLREDIRKYYQRDSLIIPPPVATARFREVAKGTKDPKTVITVGRIQAYKGLETVVELARLMPDYTFHIVGTIVDKGYYDSLNQKIQQQKLSNVKISGDAPIETLKSLLSTAKIYMHTRVNEGFGISVVEAMAAGCFPIVHHSGGPRYIVEGVGKTYTTILEAAERIRDASKGSIDTKALFARSSLFDEGQFKQKMHEAIERMQNGESDWF